MERHMLLILEVALESMKIIGIKAVTSCSTHKIDQQEIDG